MQTVSMFRSRAGGGQRFKGRDKGSSRLWIPLSSKLLSKLKVEYLLVHSHPMIPHGADQRRAVALKNACCEVKQIQIWLKSSHSSFTVFKTFSMLWSALLTFFSYFLTHCSHCRHQQSSQTSLTCNTSLLEILWGSDYSNKPSSKMLWPLTPQWLTYISVTIILPVVNCISWQVMSHKNGISTAKYKIYGKSFINNVTQYPASAAVVPLRPHLSISHLLGL